MIGSDTEGNLKTLQLVYSDSIVILKGIGEIDLANECTDKYYDLEDNKKK